MLSTLGIGTEGSSINTSCVEFQCTPGTLVFSEILLTGSRQHDFSPTQVPWLASFYLSSSSIFVWSVLEFVWNFCKFNPLSWKISLARWYNRNSSSSVLTPEIVVNICVMDKATNKSNEQELHLPSPGGIVLKHSKETVWTIPQYHSSEPIHPDIRWSSWSIIHPEKY